MIKGLSHITIVVSNLEKTSKLLCEGLGAEEVYDSIEKNFSISREKFFTLGGIWLAAMEGEPTERSYSHIAFQVNEKDLKEIQNRIEACGAEVVPSRPRIEGEGNSIYFYDYDNNFFELHSGTMEERLSKYKL